MKAGMSPLSAVLWFMLLMSQRNEQDNVNSSVIKAKSGAAPGAERTFPKQKLKIVFIAIIQRWDGLVPPPPAPPWANLTFGCPIDRDLAVFRSLFEAFR